MPAFPRIPGYELLAPLGGGSLTCVYSARDCATDVACAVKVLREEWEEEPTAIKLLQREARAGLAVRHPHLIRLKYVQVLKPPFFLVMDLLNGESLRCQLRRQFRLDLGSTVWIARQTTEALAALHRAGFLHGDLKPDNIRLIKNGTAILIDLGFAHRPGENDSLLRQGYILGTANYLAPELCGSNPQDSPASDLFGLGVMLFEMLTGRLPYPPGTLDQTFRRHNCDPPADIHRYFRSLPSELANLVERLLARRPEDRPRIASVISQLISLEITSLGCRQSA